MKPYLFVLLILLFTGTLTGQTVTGWVLDSSTGEILAYVNIGVVGQPRGTITGEDGTFTLETTGLTADAVVRFSMIGYLAQTYTVDELLDNNGKMIKLENVPVQLSEIVVKPGKLRKVGVTKFSRLGGLCGWGGEHHRARGNEIGTKIELGEMPVSIKSLHFRLVNQSFDSCVLRLHMRDIVDDLPGNELLTKDILITISEKSGWIGIDLSKYGLVCQGDIVLSLEWVTVKYPNKKRYLSVNGDKPTATILFGRHKNQCCTYFRWGSEAPWMRSDDGAACFYLTVR